MGRTKNRCKYQSISLSVPLINQIKDYIKEYDEYRSVADFVRQIIRERIDKTSNLEKRITKLEYEIEKLVNYNE